MDKKISRRTASKLLTLGTGGILLKQLTNMNNNKMMHRRSIPSTNEQLPVVGVGTWQTFDIGASETKRQALKEVLTILVEHGGAVIDSSPMYGRSEKVVGELTRGVNLKSQLFEATKVWTSGKEAGIQQMNTSIDLMQARPMDLMQIHNLVDWKTHLSTLREWKEAGKIRYIGITHYHKGGYEEVEKIMRTETIDFVQINYNVLVRDAAERILPLAKDKGIAVLINRPYAGGSVFRFSKSRVFPAWAAEFEAHTWGQLFLKFILANPAVTCVIPGTSKVRHILDNVQAGFGKLPNLEHQKKLIALLNQ